MRITSSGGLKIRAATAFKGRAHLGSNLTTQKITTVLVFYKKNMFTTDLVQKLTTTTRTRTG